MSKILIAVTGSIAAYKTPSVISYFVNRDHEVKVMMTEAAKQFITPLTFSAISKNTVYGEHNRFANDGHIHHIELSQWADILVIVPATYNTISKLNSKIADNFVMSTIAAFKGDILIFPAMNTNMWDNLMGEGIRLYGQFSQSCTFHIYGPDSGKLACGAEGKGKLMETRKIIECINDHIKEK